MPQFFIKTALRPFTNPLPADAYAVKIAYLPGRISQITQEKWRKQEMTTSNEDSAEVSQKAKYLYVLHTQTPLVSVISR